MKRILIVSHHMSVAGVEKALINYLKNIPLDEYDVEVRFIKKVGGLIDELPKGILYSEIPIKEEHKDLLLCGGSKVIIKNAVKKVKFFRAIKVFSKKIFNSPFPQFLGNFKKVPKDDNDYDIAVCYAMHQPFIVGYVAEKIKAKEKHLYVHNDLTTTNFNTKSIKKYVEQYDKIYGVSNVVTEEMKNAYPKLVDRIETKYNYIDKEEILLKGSVPLEEPFDQNVYNIVSVGRLNHQKGFDIAVEVAHALKEKGLNFVWHIVGEGEERQNLEKMINEYDLKDNFKLLGVKSNPYNYMKNCDLYVQPSRHEGYVTTITEAKVFGGNIVCCEVSGANEQLDDYENGFIVECKKEIIVDVIKEIAYEKI